MTRRWIVFFVWMAAAAACSGPAGPQEHIARIAWLQGCWETAEPLKGIAEWSAPQGDTMIGTSRTYRDGKVAGIELVELTEKHGRLAYEAHPSGLPGATYLSVTVDDSTAVFESTEPHFPQRIGYRRDSQDSITQWMEGADNGLPRRVESPHHRTTCSAVPPKPPAKP